MAQKTKICVLYPSKAPLKGKSVSDTSYRAGKCLLRLLSLDIFSIIASFLSTEDIRSARLSGRELHFFSSPYLVRAINLTSFESNNFKKKPELFHNLRTLCLDLHRYPAPAVIYHSKSYKVLGVSTPEDNLVKIFELFPKINSVILFNGPCNDFSCSRECRCTWSPDCPLLDKRLKGHSIGKPLLITLFQAVAKFPHVRISQVAIQGHWTRTRYRDNCDFQDDSDVPGSIKNYFDDFESARQWIERRPHICYEAFHDLNPEHFALAVSIFKNLTHLDILLEPDPEIPQGMWDGWNDERYPVAKARWGDVPKILEALTSMTHLSLDLGIHRPIDQQLDFTYVHDDIDVLFEASCITLHNLKTLSLAHFRSSTAILSTLLRRHPRITSLSLIEAIEIKTSNTHIRGVNNWPNLNSDAPELMEAMRALPLERLHLAGIETFDCDYNIAGSENHDLHLSRILDYILHGYGGNPMTLTGLEECMDMDEEFWDSHSWDPWHKEYATRERKELSTWEGYLPWWQLQAVKTAREAREFERWAKFI